MSKQRVTAHIYDKKGRLLSVGHNSYTKTHPKQAHFARLVGVERKTYLHAEIAAIIAAVRRGRPHHIHVERLLRNGTTGLAAPCRICQEAIKEAGIKEVSYTI